MYEICVIRAPEGPAFYAITRKLKTSNGTPERRAYVVSHRTVVEGLLADGVRVALTPVEGRAGWFTSVPGIVAVEMTTTGYPTTAGWTLRNPASHSERFPMSLSREEHRRRCDSGEEELLGLLYVARTEPATPTVVRTEGPFPTLEGREPPGPDEPGWIAHLPEVLAGRREFAHLYPGVMPGLRSHVADLIKRLPGVSFCSTTYDGYRGISVTLNVPYEPDITRWRANVGTRGQTLRTGKTVSEKYARHLRLPVPDRVPGENYADALAQWDEAVEFWIDLVREAGVKACGHCRGTGVVEDGAVSFEKEPRS